MSEVAKFESKLEKKQVEAEEMQGVLKSHMATLRHLLDPTEKLEDLDAEKIFDKAVQFASKHEDYKNLLREIKQINEILGRG